MTPLLIVFDLDGTIVDSRRDLADSVNGVIVGMGGTALPVDAIVRMVGEGASVLVRRALAAASLPDTPGHSRGSSRSTTRTCSTTRVRIRAWPRWCGPPAVARVWRC